MPVRKKGIRITIVVEDQTLDRFCREALMRLGYHRREIRTQVAPSAKGSGKQWVDAQFSNEVRVLRRKRGQSLAILVGSDVDEMTLQQRTQMLEAELAEAKIDPRSPTDRIAYWLPKWHVETWMMAMLDQDVDEVTQYKTQVKDPDFKAMAKMFVERFRCNNDGGLSTLAAAFAETGRIEA